MLRAHLLATTLMTLLTGSFAHAFVAEIADCTTSDSRFQIEIRDNQGIGQTRSSWLRGFVVQTSDKQILGTYDVELDQGVHSISFGRPSYKDSPTQGQTFQLQGPSTNMHNFTLHVSLNTQGHLGQIISDENLVCRVFGGHPIQ